MVNAFQKKIIRDIFESRWSFVAIVCVCMLGIALFSGINLYVNTIEGDIERSYKTENLADYWLYKADVTESDLQSLQSLSGVDVVQRRKMAETGVSGGISGTLRIHGIEGQAIINVPELMEGNLLDEGETGALLLDSRFADANGIKAGDTILLATGQEWNVKGIVRNVEYVYYAPDGLAVPNYGRYGFAYVDASALPEIPYNEIIISLLDNTALSHADVVNSIRGTIGSVNILSRQHHPSSRYIEDDLAGIKQLGFMFPVVFLLTAALVTWVTVSRMMDNQQQHLGTLRSLGFSRREIALRYTLFGVLITIPSMILGWVISHFLAKFLYQLGTLYYTIQETNIGFLSIHFIIATACVAFVTCGSVFLSCRKSLKSTPATLMRPKPPAQGHRIFLERITPYWSRLSFSGKIVTRNLFRNKVRLLMGIVGIVGSTTLILCGFGMRDTSNSMITRTFSAVMQFDAEIKLKTAISLDEAEFIYEALDNAEHIEASMAFSVYLYGSDGNTQTPYLVVLEDEQNGLNFIDKKGNRVSMPDKGVLITPRMANALSAEIGETITAESLDGTVFNLEIANIVDFPVGNEIYISRTAFSELSTWPFLVRAFMVQGENLNLDELRHDPRVAVVETKEDMKTNILEVLELLQSIQIILIAFAGFLAFAVLMVLGRMNFHERIRELATLKVLGFHQKEMKRLVLRENIWIAVLGLPVGIFAGFGLLQLMIAQTTNPDMEMTATISIISIVIACILIFVFASFINYLLGMKFKTINMVASLKSVE